MVEQEAASHTSHPSQRTVAAGALLSCFLWSTAFAAAKYALGYMPPLTIAGTRFILAGLLLVPFWVGRASIASALRGHWRLVVAVAMTQTAILYGAFFLGMARIKGAQGAIVLGSYPLVAAIMAHFMMHDDRFGRGKILSIAIGLGGVAAVALGNKPWEPTGFDQFVGMLLVLVGVCTSSAANILVARSRGAVHPALLNSLQMVLGGGILLAVAMRVEGPPVAVPAWQFLVVLLYMAALSAVGFTIWFALLKHQKVSRLNMWRFVIPVFGAVICWVSLEDESPDVISVIGMVCVAGSVLLSHRQAASEALAFRAGA